MLKALLSACLLLAPLSSASYIYCRQAYNSTGMTYNRAGKILCNSGDSYCSSIVLRTNIKETIEYIQNACVESQHCHPGHYSFTAGDGKFFEMKWKCCKSEMCNKILSLPDRNMMTENGLQCPSCFSKGREMCQSDETVNCLENETQCVYFNGLLIRGDGSPYRFNFKGCGTPDFCAIKKMNKKAFVGLEFTLAAIKESCYNASEISHQPVPEE